MKRLPLVLLAAVAALGAVAAFGGIGRPEAARGDSSIPAPGTVTTTGHGVVTLVPNEATVTAGVHTQSATAADALAQNAKLMNQVVAALQQNGGKQLQTQQVSLYPQTDDSGAVTGFTADDSVSATASIAAAGALIDAAVAAGANTVSGPALSVSDQDAQYRQALKSAVDDARAKAQALAEAGGFSVGPVSTMTEETTQPVPLVEKATAASGAVSTPIEPGTQEVTADVTVTFSIR